MYLNNRKLYRKLTDLTDQEKSDIIRTVKSGELFLEQVIQDAFNISKSTVNRIMKIEKEKESQIKKRQPGRPRRRRCDNNKPIDDADDKTEHSEDVSVRSFDESNNSASCWQNLTAPAALPHEQVEVIVKQELDLPLDCEIISDTENDDSRTSGFHLGLSNEGQELVTKTTVPCFLCQNSDKVTPFDDDSFDKCLNSIKFRRMKNARYGDIVLNDSDKYNLGFHTICFNNVVKIGQNWLTEYEKMWQDQKQSQDQRDIYSAYSDYIAHRLRASASERGNYEVCVAQLQIDEVLFKLSMGSYARDSIDPKNIEKTINMD